MDAPFTYFALGTLLATTCEYSWAQGEKLRAVLHGVMCFMALLLGTIAFFKRHA